jgi:hypothetical protein
MRPEGKAQLKKEVWQRKCAVRVVAKGKERKRAEAGCGVEGVKGKEKEKAVG